MSWEHNTRTFSFQALCARLVVLYNTLSNCYLQTLFYCHSSALKVTLLFLMPLYECLMYMYKLINLSKLSATCIIANFISLTNECVSSLTIILLPMSCPKQVSEGLRLLPENADREGAVADGGAQE